MATRHTSIEKWFLLQKNWSDVTMNNSTANGTSGRIPVHVSDVEKILFTSGLSILSIITIFGNVLVVMSFFMSRPLRTYTNYFIVSLSLSDISVAVISIPIWMTFIILNRNFAILDGKVSAFIWLFLSIWYIWNPNHWKNKKAKFTIFI